LVTIPDVDWKGFPQRRLVKDTGASQGLFGAGVNKLDRPVTVVIPGLRDEGVSIGVILLRHQMNGLTEPAKRLDDRARPEVATGAVQQIPVQNTNHRMLA